MRAANKNISLCSSVENKKLLSAVIHMPAHSSTNYSSAFDHQYLAAFHFFL